MENNTFQSLSAALAMHLGASSPHDSGTGVRFKSVHKGKATVYHDGVAPGNHAEVAFEVASMSHRLQMPETEFRSFVAQLRESTGRPVESNAQYNWPRVGIASEAHVALVNEALQQRLRSIS